MTQKVVIVSNRAILLQGLILRLTRSAQSFETLVVDTNQPVLLERLVELCPDVIVLDAGDFTGSASLHLNDLLDRLPAVVVILLNLYTSSIQVIRTQKIDHASLIDFLEIIENIKKIDELLPDIEHPISSVEKVH